VWICPDPWGHLQATGIDAAGRKQYLYHARWREHRDRQKFRRMTRFGESMPKLRRRVAADLRRAEPDHEQVLACAVRLLDVGMFRIGSEQYADDDGGIGLATIRREHVRLQGDSAVFDYPAKAGVRRAQVITDPVSFAVLSRLRRRRSGGPQLLAYRERRRWHPIRSDEINDYLKRHLGDEFSAKDFRTWNATVMAAVALGADGRGAATKTARRRAVDRAVRAVAELLGNTPAVARRSYIDPRVFDRYDSGWTIAGMLERIPDMDPADDRVRAGIESAVLDLLADNSESPALIPLQNDN
jgi:DNA topoisomerase IB